MMRLIEGRTLDSRRLGNRGESHSDAEFRRCDFQGCSFAESVNRPNRRGVARNIVLKDCSIRGCGVGPAIVEESVIENLTMHTPLFVWGPAFRHVELRGTIGPMKILREFGIDAFEKPRMQALFDEANAQFYDSVDWAIDISRGDFEDLCILNVPARLIRRDSLTQVVVTRSKAASVPWRELGLRDPIFWESYVGKIFLEESQETEFVMVAPPRRSPRYPDYLADVAVLRARRIVEAE